MRTIFNRPGRSAPVPVARNPARTQELNHLHQVKRLIQKEFAPALTGYESVLKLALNEAEALAWQTAYPQLFFPTLAQEKAAEVRRWALRQRALRQEAGVAFAA